MQGFLRIKSRRKRKCETLFFFSHPCGLHVPLKENHFRYYNLIGWRFVINYPNRGSMVLDTLIVGWDFKLQVQVGWFLFGRKSHPSFVLCFFLLILFSLFLLKKGG